MISLSGILTGTVIALALCFTQQFFGIIPMPGNFVIDSYPIVVKFGDVLLTIAGISLIGLLSAMLPFMIVKKIENF
jgi:lipoprotein-releasing system permease protein